VAAIHSAFYGNGRQALDGRSPYQSAPTFVGVPSRPDPAHLFHGLLTQTDTMQRMPCFLESDARRRRDTRRLASRETASITGALVYRGCYRDEARRCSLIDIVRGSIPGGPARMSRRRKARVYLVFPSLRRQPTNRLWLRDLILNDHAPDVTWWRAASIPAMSPARQEGAGGRGHGPSSLHPVGRHRGMRNSLRRVARRCGCRR
jgi:hypothetical protein